MKSNDKYMTGYHHVLQLNSAGDADDGVLQSTAMRNKLHFKYVNSCSLSNDVMSTIVNENLQKYTCLLENEKGDRVLSADVREKKVKFKSGLHEKNQLLLDFAQPLACKKDKALCCKNNFARNLSDKEVRRLMTSYFNSTTEITSSKLNRMPQLLPKNEKLNKKPSALASVNFNDDPDDKYNNLSKDELTMRSCNSFRNAKLMANEASTKNHSKDSHNKNNKKNSGHGQFICPIRRENKQNRDDESVTGKSDNNSRSNSSLEDEKLKNIDEKMIELIKNEIMESGANVEWDEVAGLTHVKKIIKEIVVYPMLRPDIFTGLRRPPKGILLFGPPGTGKTLIGKCIASQSNSTFFSISASSLTSKWVGEGEKMVRALFAVARLYQPSVVFIDEIDSLLTQRSEGEHESSRRIKTEFLVQLDGATTGEEDRILIIGATNRPQELDEAARRRFVKRLYIPLPGHDARKQIVENLLKHERHQLTQEDVAHIAQQTNSYSGADMANLCKEASMEPIRSIPFDQLENIDKNDVRSVTLEDFQQAIRSVRPSVSQTDLTLYVSWDNTYGSSGSH